jgi:hypothetical protein
LRFEFMDGFNIELAGDSATLEADLQADVSPAP